MSRHFNLTLTCMSTMLALFLLPASTHAGESEHPSFDCRKAASVSEKTICANAALSRQDFQLGSMWRTLRDDFSDSAQLPQMKADQKAWVAARDKCGADAACMGKLYQERLSVLNGADAAHRFSGIYEVKDIGAFAVYTLGDRYLVNIQTADPQEGKWTCQLTGEAEASGDDLKISVEGTVFQARLRDPETLIVPETDSSSAAAAKFCGLNGTFAFTYLRIRSNP